MEKQNVCMMNCHTCTLQEGNESKAMCATLLIPAMLNRMTTQIDALTKLINALGNVEKPAVQINEIRLNAISEPEKQDLTKKQDGNNIE